MTLTDDQEAVLAELRRKYGVERPQSPFPPPRSNAEALAQEAIAVKVRSGLPVTSGEWRKAGLNVRRFPAGRKVS
jgi:hypothetical protein